MVNTTRYPFFAEELFRSMTETIGTQKDLSSRCDSLVHPRRRYVVSRLREAARPLELTELAEYVAEEEADAREDEVSVERVNDARIDLYHSHIPKLADVGLVRYDRKRKVVELLELSDESRVPTQSGPHSMIRYVPPSQTPSTAVKRFLAELEECDPSQLGTLSHAVDVDELDELVERPTERRGVSRSIAFSYCGYALELHSSGTLRIEP